MALSQNLIEKYNVAYENAVPMEYAVTFDPSSPYYREEVFVWIMPMYVPDVLEWTYEISNYGRIFSHLKCPTRPNGGIMSPSVNGKGYRQINLKGHHTNKICCKIHRLVMLHFNYVQGCQYLEVDHIDGNKDNNSIWNLEWVTPQENTHRAIRNGLRTASPTSNTTNILTDDDARQLYDESLDNYADYSNLAKKYGISLDYVQGLHDGRIRPYIANRYNYDHIHI